MMRQILRICLLMVVLSYAYSKHTNTIEKRQCSGNNCNTCNGGNCNTCNGGNCNTCNGGNCNTCNGGNCNACNNNVCCSSASCNQCVNQCSNNCNNNASCKNNCVSGCATACQGNDNCAASSCSQCVNKCCNQCSSDTTCVNNCSKSCDCTTPSPRTKEVNNDVVFVPSSEASKVIVNNTNNNLVNLTTLINIDNVVHNINNISIPVYVNTTNINNINLSENRQSTQTGGNPSGSIRRPPPVIPWPQGSSVVEGSQTFPQIFPPQFGDNCCYVLHPRTCYNDTDGNTRCYIRRSRECSDICSSPVISIEQDATINSGCQRVNTWPYQYCGNYVRRGMN